MKMILSMRKILNLDLESRYLQYLGRRLIKQLFEQPDHPIISKTKPWLFVFIFGHKQEIYLY